MAEAVLRCVKMSWTVLCLRLVICELSLLSLAESINPLLDNDILQIYDVMNVYQCQRLCWYRKSCVRYSFHIMNGNSAESEDKCVLHLNEGLMQGQLEGWILAEASSKQMPPDHGCLPRPCSETEICVPYKGAVSFQCIHAPDIDECASSPCQNGGNCIDQFKAYTCNCPAGYTGRNCQTDIDECVSAPCQNGGTCVDQVNGYMCQCALGYTDRQCQTAVICKTSVSWQSVPGGLTAVSVGPAGVWGVTTEGHIVHRVGTYGTSGSTNGTGWTQVADTSQVALSRLDVGDDVVWGITDEGNVACRLGINKNAVTGTSWLTMTDKPRDIAVSAKGQLVGISADGHFKYREGLNSECSNQSNWIITRSGLSLSRISIGRAGIWAVDVNRDIFYRPGSIGNNGTVGSGWKQVPGSLQTISVGTFFVIGVNEQNIWRRDGVTEITPDGITWVYIPGTLVDVATTEGACYAWGVKENGSIWIGTFY